MTAQRADAVGGNDLWHYAVGSERKGPVPRTTLAKLLASGEISAETYVWQPGMDNWVHLGDAAALKSLVAGLGGDSGPEDFVEEDTAFTSPADLKAVHSALDDGEELSGDTIVESISMAQAAAAAGPRVELAASKPAAEASAKPVKAEPKPEPKRDPGLFSEVASSTSGAAAAAGADIFGGKDDALGDDIFGSTSPTAEEEQIAGVHSRRQSSVLFSLDELGREDSGGGKRSGSEQFVTDSSGLIDIKAIATVDKRGGDDPFGASAPNLVIPAGGRPNIAPMTIPIVERRRGNGPWILAAAAVLVIGGGIVAFILTNSKEKPGPEPVAQATTEPAKTEPVKTEPVKTEPAKVEVAKVEPKVEEAKVEPKVEADAGAKPPEADAIAGAPDAAKVEAAGNPVEAKVEKVEAKVEKPKTEAEKAKAEKAKADAEKAKAEAAEKAKTEKVEKVEAKVETPPTKPAGDGAAKVNDLLSKLNGAEKKDDKKDETADTSLPDKLSAAAVRAAIRGKFDRCGGMITNATGSVTVQTQFVISSSGVVQSARVTDGGGTSSDVQRCVVGVIQGTTFGKFKEPTMQVNLPVKLL